MNRAIGEWLKWLINGEPRGGARQKEPPIVAFFEQGGKSEPHPVKEISATGLYVLCKEKWYLGTVLTVTLQRLKGTASDENRAVTVAARVVRSETDGAAMMFVMTEERSTMYHTEPTIGTDMKTLSEFLKRARSDAAQALIEYILIFPVVFLLIVNTVNLGGFFFAWITVANAARAGADYAIQGGASAGGLGSASGTAIAGIITTELSSLPNNPSQSVNVCQNKNGTVTALSGTCTSIASDSEPTNYVLTSIDVTYTYVPFVSAGFHFASLNVYVTIPPTTIHRRAVMRMLQ